MFCPECGSENEDKAKFCKSCGATLKSSHNSENGSLNNKTPQNNKSSNNKIIIAAIICICVVAAGLFIVGGDDSTNNVSSSEDVVEEDVSSNDDNRYENFSESEWDKSSYTIDEIYTAHTPDDAKKEMFNQADFNGDGVLTGDEIKEMDYLLKHSDYTWNGPGIGIHSGTISTGSGASDKTYCSVYVGKVSAGENVKISVLYSRDGKNLNQGNIVPKTVDADGYVSVPSAYAFDKYPDNALITLYDSSGNVIDTKNVPLSESSGSQSF